MGVNARATVTENLTRGNAIVGARFGRSDLGSSAKARHFYLGLTLPANERPARLHRWQGHAKLSQSHTYCGFGLLISMGLLARCKITAESNHGASLRQPEMVCLVPLTHADVLLLMVLPRFNATHSRSIMWQPRPV
jgi:hypothetical protein